MGIAKPNSRERRKLARADMRQPPEKHLRDPNAGYLSIGRIGETWYNEPAPITLEMLLKAKRMLEECDARFDKWRLPMEDYVGNPYRPREFTGYVTMTVARSVFGDLTDDEFDLLPDAHGRIATNDGYTIQIHPWPMPKR